MRAGPVCTSDTISAPAQDGWRSPVLRSLPPSQSVSPTGLPAPTRLTCAAPAVWTCPPSTWVISPPAGSGSPGFVDAYNEQPHPFICIKVWPRDYIVPYAIITAVMVDATRTVVIHPPRYQDAGVQG